MSAYARQALLMNPDRGVSFSSESRQRHHSNPNPSAAADACSTIERNGRISSASRTDRSTGRGNSEGIVSGRNGGEISGVGASGRSNSNSKNFQLENKNNYQVFKSFQGDDEEEVPIEGSIHVPHNNSVANTFSQISMSQQSEEISAGSTSNRGFRGGGLANSRGSCSGGGIANRSLTKRPNTANTDDRASMIPQGTYRSNSNSLERSFQGFPSSGLSLSQPTAMPSYSQRSNISGRSRKNQRNVGGGNHRTTSSTNPRGGNDGDESTVQSSQPVLTPVLPSALRKRSSDTADVPNQQDNRLQSMRLSQGSMTPSSNTAYQTRNAETNTFSSSRRRDKRARMMGPSKTPLRGKVSTNIILVSNKQSRPSNLSTISPFSNSSRIRSNATSTTAIASNTQNNSIRSSACGTLSVLRTPLRSASALAARVTNTITNPFVGVATTPFRRIKSVQTAAFSSLNSHGGGMNHRVVSTSVDRYRSFNDNVATAIGRKDGMVTSLERKKQSPSLSPYVHIDTFTPTRFETGKSSVRRSLVMKDNTPDDHRTVDADDMKVDGDAMSPNINDCKDFAKDPDDESIVECSALPHNSRHLSSIQIDDVGEEELDPLQRKASTTMNSLSVVPHFEDQQSIHNAKEKSALSPSSKDTLRKQLLQKLNELDSDEEKDHKQDHKQNVNDDEQPAVSSDKQDKSIVTPSDEANSVVENVANQLSKLEEMMSKVQSVFKELEQKRMELQQEQLKLQEQRKQLDGEWTKQQAEIVQIVDRARQEMKDHCTRVADNWRTEFDSFTSKLESAADEHRVQIRQLTEVSKKEVNELIDGCKTDIQKVVSGSKDDIYRAVDITKNDIDQIIVTSKNDVINLVNESKNEIRASIIEAKCGLKQSVDEFKEDFQLSVDESKCEFRQTVNESKRHVQQSVDEFKGDFKKIVDQSKNDVQKSVDASRSDSRHFFYNMKQELEEDRKLALVSQSEFLTSDVREMIRREARQSIEDAVINAVTSAKRDLESISHDKHKSISKDCVEISSLPIPCEDCTSKPLGPRSVEQSIDLEVKTSLIPASSFKLEDRRLDPLNDEKPAHESSLTSNSKSQNPKSRATTRALSVDADPRKKNDSYRQCATSEQYSSSDIVNNDESKEEKNESSQSNEEANGKLDEPSKQLTPVQSSRPPKSFDNISNTITTNKIAPKSTQNKDYMSNSSIPKPKSVLSRNKKKSNTARLQKSADKKRKQNETVIARSPRRSKRLKESKRAEHLKVANALCIDSAKKQDDELATKSHPVTPVEPNSPTIQCDPERKPSSITRIQCNESIGDVSNGHDSLLGAVVTVNQTGNDDDGGQDGLEEEHRTSFFPSWRRSGRRKKAGRLYKKLNRSSLSETMSSIFEFKF